MLTADMNKPEETIPASVLANSAVSIKYIVGTKYCEVEVEVNGKLRIKKVDISTIVAAATTEQKNIVNGFKKKVLAKAFNEINPDATGIADTDIVGDIFDTN